MKIKLENKDYKKIIDMLADCTGIIINKKGVNKLLKRDGTLIGEIASGKTTDTVCREKFMEALAEELIGLAWPMYCETHEPKYKNFNERIEEAAIEHGYKVRE